MNNRVDNRVSEVGVVCILVLDLRFEIGVWMCVGCVRLLKRRPIALCVHDTRAKPKLPRDATEAGRS